VKNEYRNGLDNSGQAELGSDIQLETLAVPVSNFGFDDRRHD